MKIHELGHIVLYVTNLDRSVHFYQDILGFEMIDKKANFALFSGGRTHHEMLLIEIGGFPEEKTEIKPGLYHIGFKIGTSDQELREAINILKKGLSTVGHTETFGLDPINAWGENTSTFSEVIL